MANYFLFGAIGSCPQCADHRFSGPALLTPEASVTCHNAGTPAAWKRRCRPR